MTYEQVAQQITDIHAHAGVGVYIVRGENVDTMALHVIPVAWFIAMKIVFRDNDPRARLGERPNRRVLSFA